MKGFGRTWGPVVLAVSAFLLLSMGGAIVAAPVTVPLLMLALRRGAISGRLRMAAAVVGGLTVVEVAWAVTYVTLEEAQPWIWLLPLAAGVLGMAVLLRVGRAAPAAR